MISAITENGPEMALCEMEFGAVDFLSKQRKQVLSLLQDYFNEMREGIRLAFCSCLKSPRLKTADRVAASMRSDCSALPLSESALREKLIAHDTSTRGAEAIRDVLSEVPTHVQGIVTAQRMPKSFTASFEKRLDDSPKYAASILMFKSASYPAMFI